MFQKENTLLGKICDLKVKSKERNDLQIGNSVAIGVLAVCLSWVDSSFPKDKERDVLNFLADVASHDDCMDVWNVNRTTRKYKEELEIIIRKSLLLNICDQRFIDRYLESFKDDVRDFIADFTNDGYSYLASIHLTDEWGFVSKSANWPQVETFLD
jgi:hypothetical protein